MKYVVTFVFVPAVLLTQSAFAADASRITGVLLYPGAATVERTAKVAPRATRVELAGLPANFDPQTVRVGADAGMQITEVAIRDTGRIQAIGAREAEIEAKIQALTDQKSLLDVDAKSAELVRDYLARLSAAGESGAKLQPAAFDPQALAGVIDVIGRSGRDAFARLQRVDVQKRELDKQIQALQRDLAKVRSGAKDARSIVISLAPGAGGDLRVSYQVAGAGWRPMYRALLDSAASRVELERNAIVTQTTGEDWSGVKVRLATTQPRLAPQGPEPTTWTVGIRAPRPQMSGEILGRARPEARPMSEAADSFAAAPIMETQSTFATEFEVPGTIDIPADGRQVTLALAKVQMPVKQRIRVVPRMESAAFVTAEAERPEGVWPAGTIQLFRDGNFVGATNWNGQAAEKFSFPFGRDDRTHVVLDRVRNRAGDSGFLGNRSEREVGYAFIINSSHRSSVDLLILDAAPVSANDTVDVRTAFQPKPAATNWENKQGIHAWEHTLQPGATLKINVGYTISYPKDAAVIGLP